MSYGFLRQIRNNSLNLMGFSDDFRKTKFNFSKNLYKILHKCDPFSGARVSRISPACPEILQRHKWGGRFHAVLPRMASK